ncbi:MAG: M67 family metallopeptidase [Myxococcota bacterium]
MPPRQLTLSAAATAAIRAHGAEGYPHEVVGILAGRGDQVQRAVPLVNEHADSPRNRYVVSGLVLMRTEQQLEADGYAILGYYHSHPDHPAVASVTDRDNALPNLSYVIVSVAEGQPVDLRSWVLRDDRTAMDEQPLHLESQP